MKLFKRRQPVEMTEEERRQHELYLQELNKKNQKSFKIFGTVLWCVAMSAWAFLLVLDVKHHVGPSKILFHGVAAAITALIALPTVIDFFTAKKEAKNLEKAVEEQATLDKDTED